MGIILIAVLSFQFSGSNPNDDAEVVFVPLGTGQVQPQPEPSAPTPPVVINTPVYTNIGAYDPTYQPGVVTYFPFVHWNWFDRIQGKYTELSLI